MAALSRMIDKIGPPNERPWLFELDETSGVPKTGASWMPGSGTTWATPGLAYPLAHGWISSENGFRFMRNRATISPWPGTRLHLAASTSGTSTSPAGRTGARTSV